MNNSFLIKIISYKILNNGCINNYLGNIKTAKEIDGEIARLEEIKERLLCISEVEKNMILQQINKLKDKIESDYEVK